MAKFVFTVFVLEFKGNCSRPTAYVDQLVDPSPENKQISRAAIASADPSHSGSIWAHKDFPGVSPSNPDDRPSPSTLKLNLL
jgi:hypothetical protein